MFHNQLRFDFLGYFSAFPIDYNFFYHFFLLCDMEADSKYSLVKEHYSAHVNKLTSDNTLSAYNQEVASSFGYSETT